MAACFPGDPEVATGCAPFSAMRLNAAPARARMRQQVCEFVSQCAIDLFRTMVAQPRVQRHATPAIVGAASGGSQPGIPFHHNLTREPVLPQTGENSSGLIRDWDLADVAMVKCGEVELELLRQQHKPAARSPANGHAATRLRSLPPRRQSRSR